MAKPWTPPVELSAQEERIVKLSKKSKLYEFFRRYRHRLFDEEVQEKLIAGYAEVCRGKETVPPAQLALAMLMQAAFDVPDHEVPTLTGVDQRWQMVLDCLGAEAPAFSQGTVFNFRVRAMAEGWDRLLIEKTVQLAREAQGAHAAQRLRVAFDSSPLWGAGRVEDTFNLIGHAAAQVVQWAAERRGQSAEEVAHASIPQQAGIALLTGSSLKAALDLDWSAPQARAEGLRQLLHQVECLQHWLRQELGEALQELPLQPALATLERLIEQDTEPDPDGSGPRLKQGVAKDRRISLSDPEMRHGRKSSTQRFNGYKRHLAVDLERCGLICAVAVTAANRPEGEAAEGLFDHLEAQGLRVEQLQVDLAYVDAEAVVERRRAGLRVIAKPYPQSNRGRLTKADFTLNFETMTVTCPGRVALPMTLGQTLHFPAAHCEVCPLRSRCTSAKTGVGRSLRIRADEPFQAELRARQQTPEGRAELRRRVRVEHGLARIGQTQGRRARYRGLRKNEFDLARHATVNNCYILNRLWQQAA